MWSTCGAAETGCLRAPFSEPHATCLRPYSMLMRLDLVPSPIGQYSNYRQKSRKISLRSSARQSVVCFATGERTSSNAPSKKVVLEENEIESRVRKAVNYIKTSDKLLPFDPSITNLGLIIWQAIRDIPEEHRHRVVSEMSSR